jgi:DNA recombination protein RmuC
LWARFVLLAISVLLLIFVLIRMRSNGGSKIEHAIRDELRFGREESAKSSRELREEVSASQINIVDTLVKTIGEMGKSQNDQLESIAKRIQELTEANSAGIEKLRSTIDTQLKYLQENNEKKLDQMRQTVD